MKYLVRWWHPSHAGKTKVRPFQTIHEAERFLGEMQRHAPHLDPRMEDISTGLIYSGGRWCTEEQCA
jgi:hypothetical protein